eukprot:GILJ01029441.1.p1 GENE.GILJ01029441.1~~GILJ01029441.1.p1  ORF type:complete len:143 (+),score=3.52 GILJ01029441.1:282-710(+)
MSVFCHEGLSLSHCQWGYSPTSGLHCSWIGLQCWQHKATYIFPSVKTFSSVRCIKQLNRRGYHFLTVPTSIFIQVKNSESTATDISSYRLDDFPLKSSHLDDITKCMIGGTIRRGMDQILSVQEEDDIQDVDFSPRKKRIRL